MLQVMAEKKPSDQRLAIAAGINYRTLLGYRHRGCTARTVEEIHAWREENVGYGRPTIGERMNGEAKKRDRDDGDDLDEREQLAKIACKEAEAKKREIENEVLMGELGRRDQYEQAGSELVNMIRARLEMIPDQLSADAPAEVRMQEHERLSELIYLILMEMSQWTLTTEE